MSLRDKLRDLPTDSGVYIYMDGDGKVLYVGKAKNLRNRVRQYFFVSSNKTEKVLAMLTHIADMRYIITKSETDALALENTLIKKYSPPYNIMLKDDKQYPFVRLDLRRAFPRPEITRKVVDDGAKYFGPVMGSTKQLLAMLGDIFPTAACRLDFKKLPKNFRACLNYHIGRCSAPCIGKVDKETYDGYVKGIIEFLNGNTRQAEQRLTELMNQASQAGNFEKAIVYRDRLRLIERIKETKLVTLGKPVNLDVFAIAHNGRTAVVNQTMVRQGKVLLVENYPVTDAGLDERQTLSSFLTMYFSATNSVGSQVLLNCCPDDLAALEQLLYERYGKKIRVFMPVRGVKKQLTEMAYSNAAEQLEKSQAKSDRHEAKTSGAVRDLKNLLGLSSLPRRMECYDISNISGTDKVASMVVFTDGEKDASQYRRFKIKTVEGANDFASMEEVLNRRLSRLKEGDEGFGKRPDLIVVDGGLGQLSSAKKAMENAGENIELISLAKREELVYTTRDNEPVRLPPGSHAHNLLINIRDEAHRFAITYFRKLHNKNALRSELDKIEGIGAKRQAALLKRFKNIESISAASIEELAATEGLTLAAARNVFDYFNK